MNLQIPLIQNLKYENELNFKNLQNYALDSNL